MTQGFRDGLFCHPDGRRPDDVARRLVHGNINLRLDDPFAVALRETKDQQELMRRKRLDLESKKRTVEGQLAEVCAEEKRLQDLLEAQRAAIIKYTETREIADILMPDCNGEFEAPILAQVQAVAAAGAAECKAAAADLSNLPGWRVDRSHADENFIYVTLKRPRQSETEIHVPSKEDHRTAVRRSVMLYSAPSYDPSLRVPGSYTRTLGEAKRLRAPRYPAGP